MCFYSISHTHTHTHIRFVCLSDCDPRFIKDGASVSLIVKCNPRLAGEIQSDPPFPFSLLRLFFSLHRLLRVVLLSIFLSFYVLGSSPSSSNFFVFPVGCCCCFICLDDTLSLSLFLSTAYFHYDLDSFLIFLGLFRIGSPDGMITLGWVASWRTVS